MAAQLLMMVYHLKWIFCTLFLMFLAANVDGTLMNDQNREHKVHNIVLYPDRHSWCQTTPIKQIVSMPGYDPVTIDNNVCVGACYSYAIPETRPAEPGELLGPYCDSCQPKLTKCYHVTLKQSNSSPSTRTNMQNAPTIRKRVQIITTCNCATCPNRKPEIDCDTSEEDTSELPPNLLSLLLNTVQQNVQNNNAVNDGVHQQQNATKPIEPISEEVPELLSMTSSKSKTADQKMKFDVNDALAEILKTIATRGKITGHHQQQHQHHQHSQHNHQQTDDDLDKLQLLLALLDLDDSMVQQQLKDQKVIDFVKRAHTMKKVTNNGLTVENLREILADLGTDAANEEDETKDRLEEITDHNKQQDHIKQSDQIKQKDQMEEIKDTEEEIKDEEENIIKDDDDEEGTDEGADEGGIDLSMVDQKATRLGLGRLKGAHMGMGLHNHHRFHHSSNDPKNNNGENDDEQQQIERERKHEQHLVLGPHGSLVVMDDDDDEEKLTSLNADDVKPNHEGVVLSYENHNNHHQHHRNEHKIQKHRSFDDVVSSSDENLESRE